MLVRKSDSKNRALARRLDSLTNERTLFTSPAETPGMGVVNPVTNGEATEIV
jgi:hypothetical protein